MNIQPAAVGTTGSAYASLPLTATPGSFGQILDLLQPTRCALIWAKSGHSLRCGVPVQGDDHARCDPGLSGVPRRGLDHAADLAGLVDIERMTEIPGPA